MLDQNRTTSFKTSSTFPLTISVLNRIFDFAAVDAKDAILRLGLVNQQWHDTLNFAPSLWHRLVLSAWPPKVKVSSSSSASGSSFGDSPAGSSRWSMQSYKARHITHTRSDRGAAEFADIENCVAPDFQFSCPLIAQNLVLLHDEFHPANGLNLLFCNVCDKKVYPVRSVDEVREAGAAQRCVVMPIELRTAIQKASSSKVPPSTDIRKFGQGQHPEQLVNIAIAVSADRQSSDLTKDLGFSVLCKIAQFFDEKVTAAPTPRITIKRNNVDVSGPMCKFLSKNALNIFFPRKYRHVTLCFRVVEIQPPPRVPKAALVTAENPDFVEEVRTYLFNKVKNSQHPAWCPGAGDNNDDESDEEDEKSEEDKKLKIIIKGPNNDDISKREVKNPLGVMPENGGYQYLFCADNEASYWFNHPSLIHKCRGSPMHALVRSATRSSFGNRSWIVTSKQNPLTGEETSNTLAHTIKVFCEQVLEYWEGAGFPSSLMPRQVMHGSIARW
jgi:hypothetical protein